MNGTRVPIQTAATGRAHAGLQASSLALSTTLQTCCGFPPRDAIVGAEPVVDGGWGRVGWLEGVWSLRQGTSDSSRDLFIPDPWVGHLTYEPFGSRFHSLTISKKVTCSAELPDFFLQRPAVDGSVWSLMTFWIYGFMARLFVEGIFGGIDKLDMIRMWCGNMMWLKGGWVQNLFSLPSQLTRNCVSLCTWIWLYNLSKTYTIHVLVYLPTFTLTIN